MNQTDAFYWGMLGSIGVELVLMYQAYRRKGELPRRYKRPGFWLVRLGLTLVSGGVAAAYEVDSAILATHIGASAPLVLLASSQGTPPPPP